MKRPNKIAAGLNAWLTFEEMCGRSALLSESYLTYPIGQLLAARYGQRLVAEHPHPVLSSSRTGKGDKPRLDFAVLRPDKTVELAIETKWLSSSPNLQRDIIRDLVRLELVIQAHRAEAWLIVAGVSSDFEKLVGTAKFKGHPKHVGSDPILPHGFSRTGRLRLNPPAKFRQAMLKRALEAYPDVDLTDCIHTTCFGPYPADSSGKRYVTYLWRVDPRTERGRFTLSSVAAYSP
jgi:hypothetical protein